MAASTPHETVVDEPLTQRQHLILLGIAGVALALRLLYLWGQARNNPLFEIVRGDAYDHHAWAQALAFGPGMEPEPYYRAPLYYYLLADLYRMVGPSIVWARIAGACMGAATTYAIARLGAGLGGYRAGLWAGILAAVYWPAIYFDGELLTVGLECLLEVGLLLGLRVATRRNSLPLLAMAGAIWGLCAITRPNFLVLAPAIIFWLFIALPGAGLTARKGLATVVVFISAAFIIAPVTLRNALVGGEPIPIAYSGGVNFYIGNNPESDGMSAVLPGGRRSLRGGFEDARRIPQAQLGRPLSYGEISDYWFARGFDWIRTDPGAFAAHWVHKFRLFWSPVELPNNQPIRFTAEHSRIPGFFLVGFPAVAVLGLAGFALVRRDWRRWFLPGSFLLLYIASVVLFFCNARYRLPVFPLLVLAGGAGLSRLPQLLGQKRWTDLGVYAGVGLAAALALATNPPGNREAFHAANRGEGHKALGDFYAAAPLSDRESHAIALDHFEAGVRLKPASPYLRLALAREQIKLGRGGEAGIQLEQTTRKFPENAEVRLEFAQALAASGRLSAALEQFETAVGLQPAYADAQLGLGCLRVRLGEQRRALEPLRVAAELLNDPLPARLCAGSARLGLGQADAALAEFTAAWELNPRSANALQGMGDSHLVRGDVNSAIAHYRMALKQNSDLPASSQNLAAALRKLGQYAEVISVLEGAVRHSPEDSELLAALAFTLATAPQPHLRRGEQALAYAKRASAAASGPRSDALDAQAAALAELGRFQAATETGLRALNIARAQGPPDRVPALEMRLRGYRDGRPHRDPDTPAPAIP